MTMGATTSFNWTFCPIDKAWCLCFVFLLSLSGNTYWPILCSDLKDSLYCQPLQSEVTFLQAYFFFFFFNNFQLSIDSQISELCCQALAFKGLSSWIFKVQRSLVLFHYYWVMWNGRSEACWVQGEIQILIKHEHWSNSNMLHSCCL